jgi:hypothetical protein
VIVISPGVSPRPAPSFVLGFDNSDLVGEQGRAQDLQVRPTEHRGTARFLPGD